MHYVFTPHGVCSTRIDVDIVDGIIHNLQYTSGCDGNLKALGKLAEGMSVDEVISRLRGIDCKERGTSCSDQLARNLEQLKATGASLK